MFQLYYPNQGGGPNPSSLVEAQVNFVQFGACDRAMAKNVRAVETTDVSDCQWFPLWERRVSIPDPENDKAQPQHMTSKYELYYWLRT